LSLSIRTAGVGISLDASTCSWTAVSHDGVHAASISPSLAVETLTIIGLSLHHTVVIILIITLLGIATLRSLVGVLVVVGWGLNLILCLIIYVNFSLTLLIRFYFGKHITRGSAWHVW